MAVDTETRDFTSPIRKLMRFFKVSRDKWKCKCQKTRKQNKLLSNQTRAVERSRDYWKELARERSTRIAELERELEKISAAAD